MNMVEQPQGKTGNNLISSQKDITPVRESSLSRISPNGKTARQNGEGGKISDTHGLVASQPSSPFISLDDEQQILDCASRIRFIISGTRRTKPREVNTELVLAEIDAQLYAALGITETIRARRRD